MKIKELKKQYQDLTNIKVDAENQLATLDTEIGEKEQELLFVINERINAMLVNLGYSKATDMSVYGLTHPEGLFVDCVIDNYKLIYHDDEIEIQVINSLGTAIKLTDRFLLTFKDLIKGVISVA